MLDHLSAQELYELERPMRELLPHFSYKPGWTFSVEDGCLVVRAEVVDAYDHGGTTMIVNRTALPQYHLHGGGNFDWLRWLFRVIVDVERHEAGEFFVVDCARPFDPHA